jgi:hypothetical protein
MPADVCSMFARMPRYALAPSGTRSAAWIRATGQTGSSRHVLALFGSSSRRKSEQRSGILIRGFGVQVPGGAPALIWHYTRFGRPRGGRFGAMFAPRLLVSPDVVDHGAWSGPGERRGVPLAPWSMRAGACCAWVASQGHARSMCRYAPGPSRSVSRSCRVVAYPMLISSVDSRTEPI